MFLVFETIIEILDMSAALHISISAETVGNIGPLAVSNSMLTSSLVSIFLVALALLVKSSFKTTGKPGRLQTLFEMIIGGVYDFAADMTGSRKKAATFLPLILTFGLWIACNNWAGLLPGVGTIGFQEATTEAHAQVIKPTLIATAGTTDTKKAQADTHEEAPVISDLEDAEAQGGAGSVEEHEESAGTQEHAEEGGTKFVPYFRAGTADLNTTIALAGISVVATQYFGFKALGGHYLKKYFNFSSPIMTFVGLLELVLETAKIMSFAFRLFGNIFAGEVLLAVMMFLVPVIVPMPFYGLEIFVGMIQAVVFSMLSLVFFNLATVGHGEEH